MWNNEESTNEYEGLFSPTPDRVDHGIWGANETHDRAFSANIEVSRDWYGTVIQVNSSWLD